MPGLCLNCNWWEVECNCVVKYPMDFENNIEVIMSSYWCFTFVA
jgi:hypothetical protein